MSDIIEFAKERLAYPEATWGERELARRILESVSAPVAAAAEKSAIDWLEKWATHDFPPLDNGRQRAEALMAMIGRLGAALEDIAAGNVPRGFLDNIENESKGAFQERFATWMQKRARSAISQVTT